MGTGIKNEMAQRKIDLYEDMNQVNMFSKVQSSPISFHWPSCPRQATKPSSTSLGSRILRFAPASASRGGGAVQ